MKLKSLHDLFVQELQDMYSFESQIVSAFPKFIECTSTPELRRILMNHLQEAKKEGKTMWTLCKEFDIVPEGKHCVGMEGIIDEGLELITTQENSELVDLALISILQKIEHYEITSYGTAANYAQELGYTDAQDILYQTMQEEKAADEKLTAIAEQLIGDLQSQNIIEATT